MSNAKHNAFWPCLHLRELRKKLSVVHLVNLLKSVTSYFSNCFFQYSEVGAFYWTALAPDIVNPGREEQGWVSV